MPRSPKNTANYSLELVTHSKSVDRSGGQFSPSPDRVIASCPDSFTDQQVIKMWLHGKAPGTQEWYAREADDFLLVTGTVLKSVTIMELQAYAEGHAGLAESTQARKLAALKSLLSYATKIGYLERNWGSMLKLPKIRDRLNERILSEEDVARMIYLEEDPRDNTILRLLYSGGLRVSELCAARWCDLAIRLDNSSGKKKRWQLTVFGKGSTTRTVLLPEMVFDGLMDIRASRDSQPSDPLFSSKKAYRNGMAGRRFPLSRKTVWRVVRKAGARAGLGLAVSPHWLRHAHASHALDRGAPIHLVQKTLGHESLATTSRYTHARPDDCSSRFLAA